MHDDKLRSLVIDHDKNIDVMAKSIEHLALAVGTTTRKLDDFLNVINKQDIILEKFTNLEDNLKESFDRVNLKIRTIEASMDSDGCSALKVAKQSNDGRDARLKKLEALQTWIVRVILGSFITGLIGSLFILARS